MTFTPGVPFDGQSLLSSKPMVRGNFTSLYNTIDENHYPPGADQGKHKKAVFIDDSTTTGTAVNEVAIFPQTYDSELQLMYRPPNQGGAQDMWPACARIRAYARFAPSGSGIQTPIGHSLNCSINQTNAAGSPRFTVTFLEPFPIGSATQNLYFVMGQAQRGSGINTEQVEIVFYNFDNASSSFQMQCSQTCNYVAFVVYGG